MQADVSSPTTQMIPDFGQQPSQIFTINAMAHPQHQQRVTHCNLNTLSAQLRITLTIRTLFWLSHQLTTIGLVLTQIKILRTLGARLRIQWASTHLINAQGSNVWWRENLIQVTNYMIGPSKTLLMLLTVPMSMTKCGSSITELSFGFRALISTSLWQPQHNQKLLMTRLTGPKIG